MLSGSHTQFSMDTVRPLLSQVTSNHDTQSSVSNMGFQAIKATVADPVIVERRNGLNPASSDNCENLVWSTGGLLTA